MARSYLNDGHLPPHDAVRVEEFVNHFHYDYEQPINDAFQATLEAAPSHFGTPNTYLLRVGIKGRDILPESRKPANLVFVIDVSGSMNRGNRLGLVKKSLHLLLDCLTPGDQVGIVVYGSDARIVLNPTRATRRGVIRDAINSLHAMGSTYAEKGIRLGYQMADCVFDPEKINRVILCSDGVANVGATSPDKILKQIKKYADKGITLTSLGFGMGNYNDVLMEKLGNKGDGFYAYVDGYQDALRLFEHGGVAALEVIAREVKVQVDFNPAVVRSYRLLGYENRDVEDNKFRDDSEDGGEIGSGHACTALFEYKLREQPTSDLLATVYLRHKDPDTRQVSEVNHPFYLGAVTDSFARASSDFKLAAVAAEFAEILRGSYWAKGSDLGEVGRLAKELYRTAGDPDVEELVRLIETARRTSEELAEK